MLFDYLPKEKLPKAMEVGFGGGIALKELSKRFDEFYALDVHDHFAQVNEMLKKENIHNGRLIDHDIFRDPFPQRGSFDVVISSSVFEHIRKDLLFIGIVNIANCLKEKGCLLVGFPLKTKSMNLIFDILEKTYIDVNNIYKFSHRHDHPCGFDEIVPEIEKLFLIEHKRYFISKFIKLYIVLKCRKR
jgi:SAM-dependent methyltransferase